MPRSYSIRAIFDAEDRGFLGFLKKAGNETATLGGMFKGGLLMGAGMKAFNALTGGVSSFATGLQDTTAAWKSFESNLSAFGKTPGEIKAAKKELQSFAMQSVYSSAQMAGTYAQLSAVGVEGTTDLVKGFGAVAAAADNPVQAMKSISLQATQMAAKPTVAWMDFKIMLEQAPAGIAAVAKQMGMTTTELVAKVQDGQLATEDFFQALRDIGGDANNELMKMAQEYKTIGQAIDGIRGTITTKLEPAFSWFTDKAINGLWGVINFLAMVGNHANNVAFVGVGKALDEMISKLGEAFGKEFNLEQMTVKVKVAIDNFAIAIRKAAKWIGDHADDIARLTKLALKLAPTIIKLAIAFKLMKKAVSIGSKLNSIYQGFKGISKVGTKAGDVVASSTTKMGKAATTSGPQLLAIGGYMMMMATAVVILAAGFMLLATTAIKLAAAGGPAIAVFVGMVAAIAILMAIMVAAISVLSAIPVPILLAAGAAFIMLSAGVLLLAAAMYIVAAAAVLASTALVNVAGVLPILATYGFTGAAAILALGMGLMVFAMGAMLAGVMLIALSAGLAIAAAAMGLLWAATKGVASNIKSIAKNAKTAAVSLSEMTTSIDVVNAGLDAIGSKAKSAMNSLRSAFSTGASQATAAGRRVGQNFTNGLRAGLSSARSVASSVVSGIGSALSASGGGAYSAGVSISSGFARGILAAKASIIVAARQIAEAAVEKLKSTIKQGSPSKITTQSGVYFGIGFANGIESQVENARRAAAKLFTAGDIGQFAMAGAEASLSEEYDYNARILVDIPVNLDGDTIARVVTDRQNTNQQRAARKAGRRL